MADDDAPAREPQKGPGILPNEPPPPPPPPPAVAPTDPPPAPEVNDPEVQAGAPASAELPPVTVRRPRPSQPDAPGWVPTTDDAVILDRRVQTPPAVLAPLRQGPAAPNAPTSMRGRARNGGPFTGAAILLTGG